MRNGGYQDENQTGAIPKYFYYSSRFPCFPGYPISFPRFFSKNGKSVSVGLKGELCLHEWGAAMAANQILQPQGANKPPPLLTGALMEFTIFDVSTRVYDKASSGLNAGSF